MFFLFQSLYQRELLTGAMKQHTLVEKNHSTACQRLQILDFNWDSLSLLLNVLFIIVFVEKNLVLEHDLLH